MYWHRFNGRIKTLAERCSDVLLMHALHVLIARANFLDCPGSGRRVLFELLLHSCWWHRLHAKLAVQLTADRSFVLYNLLPKYAVIADAAWLARSGAAGSKLNDSAIMRARWPTPSQIVWSLASHCWRSHDSREGAVLVGGMASHSRRLILDDSFKFGPASAPEVLKSRLCVTVTYQERL